MRRLSETDITNYVLNELEPSERLFVESLMLGCEESRSDALAMMEVARLLEAGLDKELSGTELELDQTRREQIFAYKSGTIWSALGNAVSTFAALAACVAFSVAAPSVSRLVLERGGAQFQTDFHASQSGDGAIGYDLSDPGEFPSFASDSSDGVVNTAASEELPSRVLFPTGAVNFVEMPLPALGPDTN